MKDIIFEKFKETSPKISCLDSGFVRLVDCMPRIVEDNENCADYAIAEAARCSYQRGTKTINDDKTLIRYLMRHNHTSPLEMIEFKFHMKLPIFLARQIIRHRSANVNELSGRYSILPEEYYVPQEDDIRCQSNTNRQGSDGNLDEEKSKVILKEIKDICSRNFESYNYQLEEGVVREQARMVLPLNTYTEWYWKIDLHNLLHFLDLRCDSHAQKEVQIYANAILSLISPIIPWTIEAWEDYSPYRGGMRLSKYEVDSIKNMIKDNHQAADFKNSLEKKEWSDKLLKLMK